MGGGGIGGGGMRSGGMGGGGMGGGGMAGCGYGWWTTSITNRMTSYKKDYGDHSICETTTKSCECIFSRSTSNNNKL